MNSIIQIAIKDLRILSRDKAALFFLIGMPVMMGVFFGFMYQGVGGKPKDGSVSVGVVDEDQSKMSKLLVEKLKANKILNVIETNREDAIRQIKDRKQVGVIVVPEGFGENAGMIWADEPATVEIGKDPSRAAEAAMLEGYVMEAIGQLIPERMNDVDSIRSMVEQQKEELKNDDSAPAATKLVVGAMFDSMVGFFDDLKKVQDDQESQGSEAQGPTMQFANIKSFDAFQKKETNSLFSKLRSSWDISFPSAILWGVMGCAAGFAISLVRERTRGTLLRLQTSPMTTMELILGKGAACFVAILAVVALMIGIGVALGMRPAQPIYLAISALFIAYCYVGIMMAMSVMGKSEEAVGGAGWAVNVVLAMFGGGMIPLAFMPGFMKTMSNFSPVAWSILSMEGAIWRGFTLGEFAKPWTILAVIGTVGFGIGVFVFQKRKVD